MKPYLVPFLNTVSEYLWLLHFLAQTPLSASTLQACYSLLYPHPALKKKKKQPQKDRSINKVVIKFKYRSVSQQTVQFTPHTVL